MATPDEPFALWAERILRDQQQRLDRADRNYERLLDISADLASTQDRIETQTHRLTRVESDLRTLLQETSVRITQNEAMLRILIDMQRHRNGH